MPNINDIAIKINTQLESAVFAPSKFNPSKFYGIAEPIQTSEEGKEFTQPCYFDNDGEGISLVFDDTFTIMAFHRVDSISYGEDPEGYGPAGKTMIETASMRFIFAGKRFKMKVRPENVLAAIEMNFLKEFAPADLQALSLYGCAIEMGDANLDSYSVWDSEWKGVDYGLVPEIMLFSIPYKIISTFNKTCFSLCQ